MTNELNAKLAQYGIDYAEAMERFGGNEALFVRLASKYANDPHFDRLETAMASGDTAAAEREAHSLKGVAGNLSFVRLYDLAARIERMRCAPTIWTAHAPSCPNSARATKPWSKPWRSCSGRSDKRSCRSF